MSTRYAAAAASARGLACTAPGPADDRRWADLADLVLIISREIQLNGCTDERVLPLTQSEGIVMRYLLQSDPVAPSRLAAGTGLQRTNLSTVLRGLEHKGLIQRRANPGDGRGVTVSPTERGRAGYALLRRRRAAAVAAAGGRAEANLDAALALLAAVKDGLVGRRPPTSSG